MSIRVRTSVIRRGDASVIRTTPTTAQSGHIVGPFLIWYARPERVEWIPAINRFTR